ncbi:hypothetical protein V3C99_015617, partial [Haemonchus contortus]
RCSEFPYTRK